MSEILRESLSNEGVPLLIYKHFKYVKSGCNIGGEVFWRCVNKKCRSYMTTEGQPGKRFIVDSVLDHNHDPNDEKVKPPEPHVSTITSKRKHDEGEAEPRKIVAARIEPVFCSSSVPKEKRGILKSWSFARRKLETSESSCLTSSDDGSNKGDYQNPAVPKSDPPFPGTYLQCADPNDRRSEPIQELDARELRDGVEKPPANGKSRDEFEIAGWMYGNQLRSLDPQQRFITEKLVADIVFKARLKMLKITSRVE